MSESEGPAMRPSDEIPSDQPDWSLPHNLRSTEARLAALSPRDDRLDRERLMFLAGQATTEPANEQQSFELELRKQLRNWQTVFAGMTAVAASLLALLVARPSLVEPSTPPARVVATSTRVPQPESPANNQGIALRTNVLSTRDVLDQDFEHLLIRQESRSSTGKSTNGSSSEIPQHPPLTPADWRQVLSGSEASATPTNGSSNLPIYRGARS